MSFDFMIGELDTEIESEGYDDEVKRVIVQDLQHDNAPADGVPTDYTNSRWPSYGGWSKFCKEYGFDGHPCHDFVMEHPGFMPLTTDIHDFVKHVHAVSPHNDRLEWLNYWVTWAYKNCEIPVITNT